MNQRTNAPSRAAHAPYLALLTTLAALAVAGCGGGGGSGSAAPQAVSQPGGSATNAPTAPQPTATPAPTASPTSAPASAASPLPLSLTFNASGLYGETIAHGITSPRQLVALPNGDLLVGSNDGRGVVYIVPNADGTGAAGTPSVFVTVPASATQGAAQGIALDDGATNVYVATNQSVWKVPYHRGEQSEPTPSVEVARVRRGNVAPSSDGDVHSTSSVAVSGNMLYVGVGSSCNACVETDPTRGTIQQVDLSSLAMSTKAARFRNAIAMTVNPATHTLWAGGAGQDDVLKLNGSIVAGASSPLDGHPFDFFDGVSAHAEAVPDYGWPDCEENDHLYNTLNKANASCNSTTSPGAKTVVPAVAVYAYSTIIGATFYPTAPSGAYAFPAAYRGGAFLTMHGSWHEDMNGNPLAVPEVIYVPMSGDRPTLAANWTNSGAQWSPFLYGFQDTTNGTRIGRPTGIAVGPNGSLFVADDQAGTIYRIRPGTAPASRLRRPH